MIELLTELRAELLLLAALLAYVVILMHRPPRAHFSKSAKWHMAGKLGRMSEDSLGRPDSHDENVEGIQSSFDETSNRGREAGVERAIVKHSRHCVRKDEIMDAGSPLFNRNGEEHKPLSWGRPAPKPSSLLKKRSKFELQPQVLEELSKKGAAEHNLRLFDEFCHLLEKDALTADEIAGITKHDALGFYETLVQSCVKMNRKNKVAEVLTHMAKRKIPRTAAFCEQVLKQLDGVHWFKEALQVYPILTSDGPEPSAVMCSCMVTCAADCGRHELAKHFYLCLCSFAMPDFYTSMTILQVHSKQGDWQAALAVYRRMQACNAHIDSQVLNMVMGVCAAAGATNEVEQLLAEANLLIDGAASKGEAGTAWEFYQDMVKYGFPGNTRTCSILIKTLSPNPTGDRIRKCLDLLHEVGTMCDQKQRTRLYNDVIAAALQLGDSTVLIRSVAQAQRHRVRPTAASCQQLKELADQCKGPCRKALEVGGHKASAAAQEMGHHEAKAGKVLVKPQALLKPQAMQRSPRGSTSEESNWFKR